MSLSDGCFGIDAIVHSQLNIKGKNCNFSIITITIIYTTVFYTATHRSINPVHSRNMNTKGCIKLNLINRECAHFAIDSSKPLLIQSSIISVIIFTVIAFKTSLYHRDHWWRIDILAVVVHITVVGNHIPHLGTSYLVMLWLLLQSPLQVHLNQNEFSNLFLATQINTCLQSTQTILFFPDRNFKR